jgi:hypothetical protein
VAEAGGGDLFTDSDSRRRCGCFRRFGSFSPFLPFSLFSRFLLFSGWSFLSSRYSSLFFFVLLSSFSLLRSISSPLSPLFFRFFLAPPLCSLLFFFSPLSLLLCWLLFIGPSEWVCTVEHGEQPAGRPWGATAKARPPSPSVFWQVRGGWSAIVSGRWAPGESGRQKFKKKQPFFLLPRCVIGGRR